MNDKVIYKKEFDLGKTTLIATVYEGELCATFEVIGHRGGFHGRVTVPADILADCVYAINDESNNYERLLTPRAADLACTHRNTEAVDDTIVCKDCGNWL